MTIADLSNYQANATGAGLKAAGITEIIMGAQIPYLVRPVISSARSAGIIMRSTYAFLWDVETPAIRTQKAIDLAKEFGAGFVWLDVEDGNNQPTTLQGRINSVMSCMHQVLNAGLRVGIYTYGPFWTGAMGNTTAFSHLPLWYANYGSNGANGKWQPPIRYVNFGGWRECAIHQFASTWPYLGGIDANYLHDASIFTATGIGGDTEETDMATEQRLLALEQQAANTAISVADARADIFQLQLQSFGEAAAKAGKTDAYITVDGKPGGEVVTVQWLRDHVLHLESNPGSFPIDEEFEFDGELFTEDGKVRLTGILTSIDG